MRNLGVVMISIGFYAHYLYATTARKRWGAQWADLVTAVLYRAVPNESWPPPERRLHGAPWFFKRIGLVFIVVGIVAILAGLELI
jgi:hypothetical protein